MDLSVFQNAQLVGGFTLSRIETSHEAFVDAIGRPALAKTSITGRRFDIIVSDGLDDRELSVTLYHEVLEAATVAADPAPDSVLELNEQDFDRAAYEMHDRFGPATPSNLNRMLEMFHFH